MRRIYESTKTTNNKKQVLECIVELAPVTFLSLIESTGLTQDEVKYSIRKLLEKNKISSIPNLQDMRQKSYAIS